MHNCFGGVFKDKKVLITGHTGFKGSWLALWLQELGAHLVGYSLPPPTSPSNFEVSRVAEKMTDLRGDIRDFNAVRNVIHTYTPSVIFHLAAQPIVLHSFEQPKETFDTNVGGSIHILEAAKSCPSVKAVVMVTSDKCYENLEWLWGYRENDPLGGSDPYSASKCMAEQAIKAYRSSFFNKLHSPAVASVRAGNVIGGGDFSDCRIVPDCMKALMAQQVVRVRNPKSVRPWLNVLDPLSGYLWLASRLLTHGRRFAEAWNFGPLEQYGVDVQSLVEKAIEHWGAGEWMQLTPGEIKPEMGLLRLNWDKAANHLGWRPVYQWHEAIKETVDWFKSFEEFQISPSTCDMRKICLEHIRSYVEKADELDIPWAIESSSLEAASR